MTDRFVIAAVLNWLVVGALLGVGLRYLVAKEIMAYHFRILDVAWTDLTPRTRILMLTLMKGTGLVAVCTAVSLAVLLAVPFRAGEAWSRWAILVVGATALVPTLVGAVRLRRTTGASAPWWPHVVLLAALGLAFWLTGDFGRTGS
ncbi:MAG: hypothetical protein A3G80_13415 [Betaproteobacteria bacterium RIFCSPLOWO2_12_FULL_62_13b]|nr:MAG: hypothetical protein A3G80_13415 [Betaproteobacteria bacterium RIFCSPLOWO2_12_FULL_62_13b]